MQKMQKKKLSLANLKKATRRLAVHKDGNGLLLAPTLCSEHSATLSIACPTRGTHFIFGPAVAAIRLAQIETQTQIALRQIALLATILFGHHQDLTALLPSPLALLSLLARQQVSPFGQERTTNRQISAITQPSQSAAMYHQQQGSQPFPNAPRPPHQPAPNMQQMGFQFARANQLPDELESALAIRSTRDVDHRQIEHTNQSNQHQNQGPGTGQHGSYGSNPRLDNQQGVDWSNYPPPTKLFAPTQQQPPSSQAGMPNWNPPVSDSPCPQTGKPLGDGGRMEGLRLYTPESAGSILASFGLSNDDLEVLSHYPDDQLTPDTLPFILRDIQLNKSGNQTAASSTSSSFSHNVPLSGSTHSPEFPSLLAVTQTAGKVIDYGHASRGTEEHAPRETFKREQLSNERTVKMLPTSSSLGKTERRQVRLEHKEPNKHGDSDYRKAGCEKRKNSRSPGREFAPLSKSRNMDRDYRHEEKARSRSETRNEDSPRRSLSSSSPSRQHGSKKKFPTHAMVGDFAGMSPKEFPHTCCLCHIKCDQLKDWVDHINTVDHTVACRELRNKYPDWKPNPPSRSGRYGSRALWDPKDGSPYDSVHHSRSRSPRSPGKFRRDPYDHRPHGRPYSPPRHSRPHYHTEHGHWIKHPHSGSYTSHYPHRKLLHWPNPLRESPESYTKGSDTKRISSSSAAEYGSKSGHLKTTKMVSKSLPLKKKKLVAPIPQFRPYLDCLVNLTGIPADATEQEVTDLVASFGLINNVILLPCTEEEFEQDQGQKASVCMMKAADAQALASASDPRIRDQEITATLAEKPEARQLSDGNSKADGEKDKESGGEPDKGTANQKSKVLITGLPDSGWSQSDVIELVQSTGQPSDVILAVHIGKALVSFADMEDAKELVKVHQFKPAMFKDTELKMKLVKQKIGLSTPVALYHLFTGSMHAVRTTPVRWNNLVVIKNVPDMAAVSTVVLKLVRRFGTVIKFLALNNMIICEMATPTMATSVYKRFLYFPCAIQNNPLIVFRKPDPRPLYTKVIPAYCDTPEDKPAAEQSAQDDASHQDPGEVQPEVDGDEQEKTEEKTEEENVEVQESKEDGASKQEEEEKVGGSASPPDAKPNTDDAEAENAEANRDVCASELENAEETNPPSSTNESASREMAMPELPKMTQAMVNALLVECRTRTANKLNKKAAPPEENQGQAKRGAEQEKTAESTKNTTEEKDEKAKKQERERKEREAKKEKERKERERREREWLKERMERRERAIKEFERREERREWERREWERRRGYDERSSWSRSSYRPGDSRHGRRDERYRGEGERRKEHLEDVSDKDSAGESPDEFPFNMSDFVTVDELGDVTDLADAAVPMETCDQADAAPQTERQEEQKDSSVEATAAQDTESDEKAPESEHVDLTALQTLNNMESAEDLRAAEPPPEASDDTVAQSETESQAEECKDDVKSESDAAPALSPEVEPVSSSSPAVPARSASDGPAAAAPAEDEEERKTSSPIIGSESPSEGLMEASNKHGEQPVQDEEDVEETPEAETSAVASEAAAELPVVQQTETPTKADATEESEKKLAPYDPSKAVGLEYLVPKKGFFCKACSRFFTGDKAAEISHCKSLKHYESLQKLLQKPESSSAAVKTDSS